MQQSKSPCSGDEQVNIPLRKRETKYKTQREAAAYFGVTENTLRSWNCPCVFVGKIRARKQGCRVRYDLTEVEAWLRSRSETMQKGDAAPAEQMGRTFNQAVKEVLA